VSALASIAVASLFGSLHCVGMCGGLIGFYSSGSAHHKPWAAHGAYHVTRLLAYATLGGCAGQFGAALDLVGRGMGLADAAGLLAGAVMLIWALLSWPRSRPRLLRLQRGGATGGLLRRIAALFSALARHARQRPPVVRAALLGLSSALLPCGWLYAFAVLAAGTGSPVHGALLLAAFWSGTLPALLGLGLGVQRLSQRWQSYVPRASALVLLGLGIYNVASRWPLAPAAAREGAQQTPSCHHVEP
jgi:sulfite exporter TauE/SafE